MCRLYSDFWQIVDKIGTSLFSALEPSSMKDYIAPFGERRIGNEVRAILLTRALSEAEGWRDLDAWFAQPLENDLRALLTIYLAAPSGPSGY